MPRKNAQNNMALISVHVPSQMLKELDELVKRGVFPSRSEAIRVAIRDLTLLHNGRSNSEATFLGGR